jgi:hypothetical protein
LPRELLVDLIDAAIAGVRYSPFLENQIGSEYDQYDLEIENFGFETGIRSRKYVHSFMTIDHHKIIAYVC